MIPFPFWPLRGLQWQPSPSLWPMWRATDDDPSFILSFKLFRPRFLLLELDAHLDEVDPILYLDKGKGFSEQESFLLPVACKHLCIIAAKSLSEVIRLRVDPATYPVQFQFKLWAAQAPAAVLRAIASSSSKLEPNDRATRRLSSLGQDTAWAEAPGVLSAARRRFFAVSEHYRQVIALAALQHSVHEEAKQTPHICTQRPLISFVVPTFNTPARYLDDLLASFKLQRQGLAELILSDDGSTSEETTNWLDAHGVEPDVLVLRKSTNDGIAAATNLGLAAARGAWIGLLDHDDGLSPYAVFLLAKTIADFPHVQFIYTDEIIADKSLQPVDYFLKPAFDDVLLSGVNYINHLSLYRKERVLALGGLRSEFDGSQDYDLLLRYTSGLHPSEILHLPYPAYIWRRDGRSYSSRALGRATANARKALAARYGNNAGPVSVGPALSCELHRVRLDHVQKTFPKISIVIPNRDTYPMLRRLLDQLLTKTAYLNCEIIIIDNGSKDRRVLALYEELVRERPSTIVNIEAEPFNFSRSVNKGLRLATGDYVLLLNNDIEITEPNWLTEMLACFAYPRTGIVGARLLYPDRTIQHAGVIIGLGGLAGHWFCGKPGRYPGPMARLHVRQSFSAVTGACMLISRACLEKTGFFDEASFAIAYNDIDFCLRAQAQGYRTVWTPFATLIHHESASRGSDESKENIARFKMEQSRLVARYATPNFEDRAFNPWYSRHHSDPGLVFLDHLPKPRF